MAWVAVNGPVKTGPGVPPDYAGHRGLRLSRRAEMRNTAEILDRAPPARRPGTAAAILAPVAVTWRHTARGALTEQSWSQAVAELPELAGNRPDLLAEHAGVALGLADDGRDNFPGQHEMRAELCILADADAGQIERWRPVGYSRAVAARQIPRTW